MMALPDADTLSRVLRALLLVAILSPQSLGGLSSSPLDAGRNGFITLSFHVPLHTSPHPMFVR